MSDTDTPDEFWDIDRLAEYLGATRSYVYRMTSQGRISYHRFGGRLRFHRSAIDEFIAREARGYRPPKNTGGRPRGSRTKTTAP